MVWRPGLTRLSFHATLSDELRLVATSLPSTIRSIRMTRPLSAALARTVALRLRRRLAFLPGDLIVTFGFSRSRGAAGGGGGGVVGCGSGASGGSGCGAT